MMYMLFFPGSLRMINNVMFIILGRVMINLELLCTNPLMNTYGFLVMRYIHKTREYLDSINNLARFIFVFLN